MPHAEVDAVKEAKQSRVERWEHSASVASWEDKYISRAGELLEDHAYQPAPRRGVWDALSDMAREGREEAAYVWQHPRETVAAVKSALHDALEVSAHRLEAYADPVHHPITIGDPRAWDETKAYVRSLWNDVKLGDSYDLTRKAPGVLMSVLPSGKVAALGAKAFGLTKLAASAKFMMLGKVGGEGAVNWAAHNVADASRLRTTYALREAGILDESGRLTEAAIENSRRAISKNSVINNNPVVQTLTRDGSKITDWTKKTTESIPLPNGQRIQVHYYQNTVTGKIDYIHSDFKVKGVVNDLIYPSNRTMYEPKTVQDIFDKLDNNFKL